MALDDLNSMFCSPGKTQNELEAEMLVAEQEVVCESNLGAIKVIIYAPNFLDCYLLVYHCRDLYPYKKRLAEQEEFQVFEDPEGEIGDALVREMHLYRDTDGYISGSGAEADVVIVDENGGLHQSNPHCRNLSDPGYGEMQQHQRYN